MKKAAGWTMGLCFWAGAAFGQSSLSLDGYLDQVKTQGPDFQSSRAAVEAYEKQSHQQDLIYSPMLVTGYNHMDDQSLQSSLLSTDRVQQDSAGISITDKLPFGPSVTVGYAFNDFTLTYSPELLAAFGSGASSAFLSSYYQISPVVSLSMPLFKDFGGAQTSAGVHEVQYQLESAAKGAAFQSGEVLYEAKVAYWNLALALETIVIRQDTLDRSQKIWEWTKRRVARNLADPPDALQAEASVRLAELDLAQAQEDEKSAQLRFNRYRGLATGEVSESLESLEDGLSQIKVDLPETLPDRLDLKAAAKNADSHQAAYDEASQNIYPDITLNASWRGNGLDPNLSNANEQSWGVDHPTWNLGAQFNLPLDVFTASRASEGYKRDYESAKLALQDKKIQVTQDWQDWKNNLEDLDKRLGMVAQIEQIQKTKADEERKRLELGRTTQFQLLSFENDYALARLNRLSLVAQKLALLAKAQWWLSGEKGVAP